MDQESRRAADFAKSEGAWYYDPTVQWFEAIYHRPRATMASDAVVVLFAIAREDASHSATLRPRCAWEGPTRADAKRQNRLRQECCNDRLRLATTDDSEHVLAIMQEVVGSTCLA
jgi:hypothetical protein